MAFLCDHCAHFLQIYNQWHFYVWIVFIGVWIMVFKSLLLKTKKEKKNPKPEITKKVPPPQ